MKKIAVVLSGCGYLDGAEIREAVSALLALSQNDAEATVFAPNQDQADVMDHQGMKPAAGEKRNALIEAARIARGNVQPIEKLDTKNFDGIVLPGGYGAAKNLSTFATEGSDGKLNLPLANALKEFHSAGKPIGAICIAPAVVALTFKDKGLELTVGQTSEASQEIEKLGHKHVPLASNACHVDAKNKVVSTPAYMDDNAPLKDVFEGISKTVTEVLRLTN